MVMDVLAAHTTNRRQAIDSEQVREALKEVLFRPERLYEVLRDKARGLSTPKLSETVMLD
jgi:hypothetical protein